MKYSFEETDSPAQVCVVGKLSNVRGSQESRLQPFTHAYAQLPQVLSFLARLPIPPELSL